MGASDTALRLHGRHLKSLSMQAAFAHFLMLAGAAVIARLGWYMAHNPTRTLRFFTFGTEPAFGHRFGVAWCKIVGWFFCCWRQLGCATLPGLASHGLLALALGIAACLFVLPRGASVDCRASHPTPLGPEELTYNETSQV
jgi:hypothetical protein